MQGSETTNVRTEEAIGPYLSAQQLAALTPWSVRAIEKMVARGLLLRGVHYFQPFGRRSQRIFKWAAIKELIESGGSAPLPRSMIGNPPVVGRMNGQIDVEKATAELQRLLG